MKVSISSADIDPLKSHLLALAPRVKSSHRVEAMARGLGFGSHAALLSGLRGGTTPCAIDDHAFGDFLKDRGGSDLPYDILSEAVVRAKLADAREAIETVLAGEPALCMNGLRTWDRRLSAKENRAGFELSRSRMTSAISVQQFRRAVAYLETLEKSPRVARGHTSYGYKHSAEHFHKAVAPGDDPYVANGMFIAAALHLGFIVKRDGESSPNVLINIAQPKVARDRSGLASGMRGPKRSAAWRNMMVAAINAGLEQDLFGLGADDNRWGPADYGVYRFTFDDLPAIASVGDAGWGELSVHVAINPSDRAERFIVTSNAGFIAGDAFAAGWLEREKGQWLQVGANPTGCVRAALLDRIVGTRPTPVGYADNGRFMM